MKNNLSCLTANFIGRHPGYPMPRNQWSQYQADNEAYFRPEETFEERFDALVGDIQEIGFSSLDLWYGILNPSWASQRHLLSVKNVLQRREMKIAALAGNIGDTVNEVRLGCRMARELECHLLTGDCAALESDYAAIADTLKEFGVRLALLNRSDKNPAALAARVRGGVPGLIGVTVDTGAFALADYPADKALEELSEVLMYVHLKDVKSQGLLQQNCRYGLGMVDLPACVRVLEQIGYQGGISVVDESLSAGPEADLKASLEMLKSWLK